MAGSGGTRGRRRANGGPRGPGRRVEGASRGAGAPVLEPRRRSSARRGRRKLGGGGAFRGAQPQFARAAGRLGGRGGRRAPPARRVRQLREPPMTTARQSRLRYAIVVCAAVVAAVFVAGSTHAAGL